MLAKALLLGTAAFAAMVGAIAVRDEAPDHRRHSKILTDPSDIHPTTKISPPTKPAVDLEPSWTTKVSV